MRERPHRQHLRLLTLLIISLALMRPGAVRAQPSEGAIPVAPTPAPYVQAIAEAQDSLRALMKDGNVPGLTAAVAVDGQIVWAEGFGYADVENRVPVWPHTKMRVGSVSKSLTSAAVGLLVEAGKLDLDAPVQQYVPSFPEKRYPITTRQVAGHLAGIRHYRDDEFLSAKHYNSVEKGLDIFEDDSLLFRPGERFQYSSYGWNLVSAVVEGASGQNFLPYMRAHVIRPLGLRHTVADHTDSLIYNRARPYVHTEDGALINAPYVDNSYKWAGGGYLSTAGDLVRFGSAMIEGDLLKPETVDLLFTSQHTNDEEKTGYGIGWFVDTDDEGRRRIGHGGGSIGGTTQLLLYPDQEVVVAVISNLSNVDYRSVPQHIATLFME